MKVEFASLIGVGRKFKEAAVVALPSQDVFAVFGGLGGSAHGERASLVASAAFRRFLEAPEAHQSPFVSPLLTQAITDCNREMKLRSEAEPDNWNFGASIAAIQTSGQFVSVAHVGCCRVYRYSRGQFAPLTQDHSLVQSLITAGKLTLAESKVYPYRAVVIRSLGGHKEIEVDCQSVIPGDGDVFLLSTDGLNENVDEAKIENVLRRGLAANSSLDEIAKQLVAQSDAVGERDQVAVVLVRILLKERDP